MDGSKAIRGGVPLVFPQFGTGEIMAGQHGFARNQRWKLKGIEKDKVFSCATLVLTESEATMAVWPFKFELVYSVCLYGNALKTQMNVKNTGSMQFNFHFLFHTYFNAVASECEVDGLGRVAFQNKLLGNQVILVAVSEEQTVAIDQEVDRTYMDTPDLITLRPTSSSAIVIEKQGCSDVVVWNPWISKSKAMADFGDEEYKRMICVEVGKVATTFPLNPNCEWAGSQIIKLSGQ